MNKTGIPYCDFTWNPLAGCSRISPGCGDATGGGCWAEHLVATRMAKNPKLPAYRGLARARENGQAQWSGKTVFFPERLKQPARVLKPSCIFACDLSDLFHESVTDGQILAVFLAMRRASWHTFLVLTKRAARMREWVAKWNDLSGEDPAVFKNARGPEATRAAHPSGRGQMFASYLETLGEPPPGAAYPTFDWSEGLMWAPQFEHVWPNVWPGVSVDTRQHGLPRIDDLRAIPAAVRWLSIEPLLEDVGPLDLTGIGWVVVGGESDSGLPARRFDLRWARDLRDQCIKAGTKFYFKQAGSTPGLSIPAMGEGWHAMTLRDRAGADPDEWPADLRVRQMPEPRA